MPTAVKGGGCVETRRLQLLGARFWLASGFRLELVANPVLGASEGLREALKHAGPSKEANVGLIHPGIAAISPLIPTKAIIRLML